MKPIVFKGAATALITPMNADQTVDYSALKMHIERQISAGTDAIVICGTTGESAALKYSEHLNVIEAACAFVNHRIPVIAGAGSNDTQHAVGLSRAAARCGADALLLVTPYYNKTSQSGLVRHFNEIADAAGLPCILYNVPSRTGVCIKTETYLKLAEHPLIVAVKEAAGNISAVAQTAAQCKDNLRIYSGNDDQIVPILSLGGIGVISVLGNILPQQTHEICSLYFQGKQKESCALQLSLLELISALFCDVNPIPVKEALNILGISAGPCRLPLTNLNEENRTMLIQALKHIGLLKDSFHPL